MKGDWEEEETDAEKIEEAEIIENVAREKEQKNTARTVASCSARMYFEPSFSPIVIHPHKSLVSRQQLRTF